MQLWRRVIGLTLLVAVVEELPGVGYARVEAVAFSPDGRQLAVIAGDEGLVWDVEEVIGAAPAGVPPCERWARSQCAARDAPAALRVAGARGEARLVPPVDACERYFLGGAADVECSPRRPYRVALGEHYLAVWAAERHASKP